MTLHMHQLLGVLALALVGVVDVCQGVSVRADSGRHGRRIVPTKKGEHVALTEVDTAVNTHKKSKIFTAAWIENMSHILPMDLTPRDNRTSFYSELQYPHHHTAIVTFAGKDNTEHIDGALMLGMSVQKHLPEYVRVAMIVKGMGQDNRIRLRKAGWKLITVPDWGSEYCGEGCDQEFLERWGDSFEKINVFRLPFKRVLFMDSDTFIFKDTVKRLVELELPTIDHIAMAKDGCSKDEYNSGVMFFKPDLQVFRSMLVMGTQRHREQILDQNLINEYYRQREQIHEISRMYNCMDRSDEKCDEQCTDIAVVAHFSGYPKPTSPERLELLRRPNASRMACMNTDFGACGKWSEYYCHIREHSERLSPEVRNQLWSTGPCCHARLMTRKEKRLAGDKYGIKMADENFSAELEETCQEPTHEWIEKVSHVLHVDFTPLDNHTSYYKELQQPHHHTAVVTFAGKNNPEYIDGAAMLGMSAQKYLPEYVRVAMIIEGMPWKSQVLLKRAGWKLATVPNWEGEYCGENCELEFLGRWHDSFEKMNAFRLPFKRVLFMDSDTYIFKDRVRWLVEEMKLPTIDHIAMAKDGCKDEYNSGVMVFKPDLRAFRSMLTMVTQRRREQILDQNLINDYYRGKIFPIDRKFNCVDTIGIQPGQSEPCDQHCTKGAVVAHFTGHPKPTSPKRRLLELVRRPNAPALACMNTNFGSCGKWSEYYCDIRTHSKRLSPDLQEQLKNTGTCCHPHMLTKREKRHMAQKHVGFETCQECPSTLRMSAPNAYLDAIKGEYVRTTIPSSKFNGYRPIYMNLDNNALNTSLYLFFQQEKMVWSIGDYYNSNIVRAYAGMEAQCPRDTKLWSFWNGQGFTRMHFDVKKEVNGHGAPKDTEHIAWNPDTLRWEHDKLVWSNSRVEAAKVTEDDMFGDGETSTTATSEEEGTKPMDNKDAVVDEDEDFHTSEDVTEISNKDEENATEIE